MSTRGNDLLLNIYNPTVTVANDIEVPLVTGKKCSASVMAAIYLTDIIF
jgi:hypothetical protein